MDFATLEIIPIPTIIILCYMVGMICKKVPQVKDDLIPIIVGVFGGILGIVAMYVMPDFPTCNILTAQAIGIVSGLSATGIHQIGKQNKPDTYIKETIEFSLPK